jgi:hypothetical protein
MMNDVCRYDPGDFDEWVVDVPEKTVRVETAKNSDLKLDPAAAPPFHKWEVLKTVDTKIAQTWEGKRKDLQDQSASSYDFALANYAVMADWTDQEIVDLLIARRHHAGDDLKLRSDYYARTIANVRATQKVESDDVIGIPDKGTLRDYILMQLGGETIGLVKYLSEPPIYRLLTTKGSILIGEAQNLLSQTVFRARVFDATKHVLPKFTSERWQKIISALGALCEEQEVGEESTDSGQTTDWLRVYLRSTPISKDDSGILEGKPFIREDQIHISGADFRRWLMLHQMERISSKQMGILFRAAGCTPGHVGTDDGSHRTTRSVWKLPDCLNEKK